MSNKDVIESPFGWPAALACTFSTRLIKTKSKTKTHLLYLKKEAEWEDAGLKQLKEIAADIRCHEPADIQLISVSQTVHDLGRLLIQNDPEARGTILISFDPKEAKATIEIPLFSRPGQTTVWGYSQVAWSPSAEVEETIETLKFIPYENANSVKWLQPDVPLHYPEQRDLLWNALVKTRPAT